jgi:two-component system, LytTR family, sensor kinase
MPAVRMSSDHDKKPFAPTWLLVTAAATSFGLFESTKSFVFSRLEGRPLGVLELLRQNMPWWYAWGALVPVVVWVAKRVRLDEPQRVLRRSVLHFAAATTVAAIHILIVGLVFYYTAPAWLGRYAPGVAAPTPGLLLSRWLGSFLVSDMLTYWIILGVYYAVDYQRRYRASALLSSELAARAATLEHRATEARLHALQMELNPHFLFNALNSIAALIRKQENATAVAMVARLGELLRATLDRDAVETRLGDELRLLELYLDIERARFANRLRVDVDVPANLHDARVPTLVLQPIVENSIRHGVARVPGPAVIVIRARRADDRLTLEVEDTGVGFPSTTGWEEGIGLSNTRARLEQLHGTRAGIATANANGRGAVTRLWLPFSAMTASADD